MKKPKNCKPLVSKLSCHNANSDTATWLLCRDRCRECPAVDLLSSMLTYSFVYTNDVYQPDDEELAGGLPAGPGGHCRHLPPGTVHNP